MKRNGAHSALGGLLKALATIALCVGVSQVAAQGIRNTKHNLGSGQPDATNNHTTSTAEVCVFCHTPHGASRPAGLTDVPPLWNKALPTDAATKYSTYSTGNSSSIDGEVLSVGSVSLACLSCHDGTQAMDNIINAPNSGNNSNYDATGGGPNGLGYTWVGTRVDANGLLTNSATSIAMLGTDLRDDHPIGIQYCGGGKTTTAPAGACADPDFNATATTSINGSQVWWVDTGDAGTGTREKGDMILFTRAFTAGTGPSVECATCHDPHVAPGQNAGAAATGNRVTGPTFLRVSNDNSAVCLACHNK